MRLAIIFAAFFCSAAVYASDKSGVSTSSIEDMYRLVEAESDSRKYLWCSILSGKLEMKDVRQLFVRKAANFSKDQYGFLMAHSYMTGFVDSEVMHLQAGDDSGEIIASMYSSQCMKELLPSK